MKVETRATERQRKTHKTEGRQGREEARMGREGTERQKLKAGCDRDRGQTGLDNGRDRVKVEWTRAGRCAWVR